MTDLPSRILRAYVDETGDQGFTGRSSKVFALSGVLVPSEADTALRELLARFRREFGIATDATLHWTRHVGPGRHDRRRHVAMRLAEVPGLQVVYAIVDKAGVASTPDWRTTYGTLYDLGLGTLFEQTAFAARDWEGGPRHTVTKIAHVRGQDCEAALTRLRRHGSTAESSAGVPWPLVTKSIEIVGQSAYDGLQAADLYSGMLRAALTPDDYGNCSPEYLLECAHQIRRGADGDLLGHGIRVMGNPSTVTEHEWWQKL